MTRLNHLKSKLLFHLKFFFTAFYYAFRHPRKFWNALSKRGQKWALRGFITLLIILIGVPASLWYQAKHAQAAWWNDSWQYRIAIPVTNNGAEQTNVYVSTTVNTSDATKFQADCGDIRFTKLRGEVLPYYIVSGCGTASTVIHVNFEVFPAGAQTVYMYYGNPSAPNGFAAADFANLASSYAVGSLGTEEKGPGPIAYWKFDEGQGGTAQDATVNNNDGTITGATWKPESECVSGKCLSFDGSGDYVNVPDSPSASLTGNFSSFAWIKTNSITTQQGIIEKWDNSDFPPPGGLNGYYLQINSSGKLKAGTWTSGMSVSSVTGQTTLEENKWYFVGTVFNGSTIKIYLNSKEDGSNTGVAPTNGTLALRIGSNPFGSASFSGSIDEPKIYPYARTSAQIQQDYNSGKAGNSSAEGANVTVGESPKWMTDGLVGHWKMDESSGTVVADASGNGNTGTLTNAQETGTAQTGSNTTTILDGANAALSATNDAYKNMILQITSGAMSGTQRTITGYTGATKTFAFAALSGDPTGATYIILHQTGGKFGNGLKMDPNSSFAQVPDNGIYEGQNQLTASIWVWDDVSRSQNDYFNKGSEGYGADSTFAFIGAADNAIRVRVANDMGTGVDLLPSSSGIFINNSWNLLTVTYDGSKVRLYSNGVQRASANLTGITDINTHPVSFGGGVTANDGFDGILDDARIYNRALSPDEVKQLSEYGPGPVGHWKMDENVSGNGQTIKDSSGFGNNGTTDDGANNTGMDCTKQGKYGGGCSFDGTDDYTTISDNSILEPASAITVGAWIKRNGPTGVRQLFLGKGSLTSAANTSYWFEINTSNQVHFELGYSGSSQGGPTSTDITITDSNWHYVVAAWDGSVIKIYIDGIKSSSQYNVSGLMNNTSQNFSVGRGGSLSSFYSNGLIDDVRIYNYARTSKQITEDMNAGHPIGGSPVGSALIQLKFDEGQGATANNSGNGGSTKNGTMTPQGGGQTQTYEMWSSGGKWGRAADLDGTDDYVSIPDFSY